MKAIERYFRNLFKAELSALQTLEQRVADLDLRQAKLTQMVRAQTEQFVGLHDRVLRMQAMLEEVRADRGEMDRLVEQVHRLPDELGIRHDRLDRALRGFMEQTLWDIGVLRRDVAAVAQIEWGRRKD